VQPTNPNRTPLSRPVLLTGLPRCGSSWVGQWLAGAESVRYRYESLNPHWVPALEGRLGHFRYLRPADDGPAAIVDATDRAFQGRQSAKQLARAAYRGYLPATLRREGRLVLKDPTACLLAGWLQRRQDCRVVVLVRHPCGFAASIRALGWPIRLERLLAQPDLVEDHLEPFLPTLLASRDDPLASLGAFWAAIHHVLRQQADATWVFGFYEELCLAPERAFGDLGRAIGLELPPPAPDGAHRPDPGSTRKDGARVATGWRRVFSDEEMERVLGPVRNFGLEAFVAEDQSPSER
jgi:hypothetical protein